MKVEHEEKLKRNEFDQADVQFFVRAYTKLWRLEPVSLIRRGRLQWFGQVDDADGVNRWWRLRDAQRPGWTVSDGIWRVSACPLIRIRVSGDWQSRRKLASLDLPGKWPLKRRVCMCNYYRGCYPPEIIINRVLYRGGSKICQRGRIMACVSR